MVEKNRKSGIEILGDVPWGTHFCQFYRTKEDLLDILVPYFKVGLENNEFCMWITSKPLVTEEAEKALRKALPHFDQYREKGQIEIGTHTDWYLKDDTFDFRRVLDAWIDKLNQALTKGYDGMRVTGNTAWLEQKDWKSFTEYEKELNNVIGKYRIIAICSYSIDRCSAPDVIDVVSNHGFALIRKEGAWKIIEDSEQTRLKKALYSTTEQYRSFVQNFYGIAFYRYIDFTPIFLHGALEEITGYTEEMFISGNLRWDKIIHPEDLTRLSELFEKMRSIPEHSDVYEYRIIRKDGQVRWIQEYCQNLCDDSGKPIIVRGAQYDITERKRIENTLRDSEEKYRTVVENVSEGIVIIQNGMVKFVNPKMLEISGYSEDEVTSRSFIEFIHPDDRQMVMEHHLKRMKREEIPEIYELRFITRDGDIRWIENNGVIIVWKGNTATLNFLTDITERKRAEEQLSYQAALMANVNDAIVASDAQYRLTAWNAAAESMYGWKAEEVLGRYGLDITKTEFPGVDKNEMLMTIANTGFWRGEVTQARKDGTRFFVEIVSRVLSNENGKIVGYVSVNRDITERKRAEEALRERDEFNFALFQHNPIETIVTDLEGRVVKCNMAKKKSGDRIPNIGDVMYRDYAGKHEIDMYTELIECIRMGKLKEFTELKYGDRFLFIKIAPFSMGAIITSQDITERKRAEEELKKSVQLLKDTGEMAKVGGWELDLATKEVSWTEEVARIHGVGPKYKMSLEEAINFYAPESIPILKATLKKTIETGEPYDLESLFIPSGSKDKIWVRSLGRAIYSGGKIVKLAGTFQNIDKYKRAEEALWQERTMMLALLENIPDRIYFKDTASRFLRVNNAVARLFGLNEPAQVAGKSDLDFFSQEHARQTIADEQKVLETGQPIVDIEEKETWPDGSETWVLSTKMPLRDSDGKIIGTFGISHDITERKRAEKALQFTRFALDNAVDSMVTMGQDGRFIDVNDAFCRSVGYSREELLSMSVHDMDPNHPAEIWPEFWEKLKQSGSLKFESRHRTKEGKVFPVEVTASFFEYNGKEYHCGFARDITERKQIEEEIRNLAKFPSENPNPVLRINADGKILYSNLAVDRILKKARLSIKQIYKILPNNINDFIKKALETGEEISFLEVCVGSRIFSYSLVPITVNNYINLYGRDITERKKTEKQLIAYQNQLRSLASELSKTEERERRRISEYLHDRICQALVVTRMKFGALKGSDDKKEIDELTDEITTILVEAINDMRSLTFDLSPPILHELGFVPAIEWEREKICKENNILIKFKSDKHPKPVDEDTGVFLFRSVQELLQNIVKHSQARSAEISIRVKGDFVNVVVNDDGIGFDISELEDNIWQNTKFGLFSIRERMESIGGSCKIVSESGHGTCITLVAPLKHTETSTKGSKT